jgi:hypothetical protein
MGLWNRIYVALVLLPLLLLVSMPVLRVPAQKLFTGRNLAYYDLPLGFRSERHRDQGDEIPAPPNTLDDYIYELGNGVFPASLNKFNSTVGPYQYTGRMWAFAELFKSHPGNALLLVEALGNAPASNGRVAGPWEDQGGWDMAAMQQPTNSGLAMVPPPPGLGPVPSLYPSSDLPLNYLNSADIALGLKLARRGQKLEPNNTFFDWMLMHFLFAARYDDEAVQVLRHASHKTGFDMHWHKKMNAVFTVAERSNPQLAEEKWTIMEGIPLRYLSLLRHISRMTLWTAMQKEDAGDGKAAVEIEGALARLHMVGVRKGFFDVDRFGARLGVYGVWRAPQFMRWARVLNVGRPAFPKFSTSEQLLVHNIALFTDYARKYGRNDLAMESQSFAQTILAVSLKREAGETDEYRLSRYYGGAATMVSLWWWIATLAMWQCLTAIAILIASLIVGPVQPPRGAVLAPVSSRIVVYPLVIGSAFSVVSCAFGSWLLCMDWKNPPLFCGMSNFSFGTATTVLGVLTFTLTPLCAFLGLFVRVGRRFKAVPVQGITPPFTPLDLGTSPAMDEILELFWKIQNVLWFRVLPILTMMGFLVYVFCQIPVQMPWGRGGSWIPLFEPISATENWPSGLGVAMAVYCFALLGRWRFGMSNEKRAMIFAGALAFRRVLVWAIPISLWFLIFALVMGQRARIEFDDQINKFLQSEKRA